MRKFCLVKSLIIYSYKLGNADRGLVGEREVHFQLWSIVCRMSQKKFTRLGLWSEVVG